MHRRKQRILTQLRNTTNSRASRKERTDERDRIKQYLRLPKWKSRTSGQDKARKHRKTAKAAISFVVMIVLLVALFFCGSEYRKPESQLPGTTEKDYL